jgi:hypothetical protein
MPSLSAILLTASEKLQINFRRSLSSSMLSHVTMPLLSAAVVGTHQRYSKQKGESSMTSRNLKRIAAFAATAALVLAGMLVLAPQKARAQSESQAGRIEGTWRVQLTVRNCQTGEPLRSFPALFTFAKGGTLTATTAGQSPALFSPNLGVWGHTDGNTYSAVSEAFVFSPAGAWIQTHRLTRAIELSSDANEFTDTVTLEIFDTNRNLIATGCGTSAGRRFE